MKHRHIFVPPFWKYNRFCLFCGRLESLTVGRNTVQLTDDKISFGADATLNAAKQLGFSSGSALMFHDGTGAWYVATTDQAAIRDVEKVTSVNAPGVTARGTTNNLTCFSISFTPNFYAYPNGYLVFIMPSQSGHIFTITNDYNGDGTGVAGTLYLRHYITSTDTSSLSYVFTSVPLRYITITDYRIRLTRVGSVYYLSYYYSGKHSNQTSYYGLYSSQTFGYSCGFNFISTSNIPDRIGVSIQWSVANLELSASFLSSYVILYGLK